MFGVTTSEDYQPVAWVGRYPLHVTTLLVAVHVACMVVAALVLAFGGGAFLSALVFDNAEVIGAGHFWQLLTYAFVHPPYPATALLWFAVEMYILFVFGREVERFLGRKAFITLYLLLLFVPVFLLLLASPFARFGLGGSSAIHFGAFVAFATIYPSVELLLRLQARWIAAILAGIGTLAALAGHDWSTLLVLWSSIGVAWLFVRQRGLGLEPAWFTRVRETLRPRPKFKVVPKTPARPSVATGDDVHESIDPILEKISKSGIGSLSAGERQALDRARARLMKEK